MSEASLHTTELHEWIGRMRNGDRAAADELLRRVGDRLERLARCMLRDYPGVRRQEQTDTVLQNSLLRLLRALQEIQPANVRGFFALAALQMRRELLDLARRRPGHQNFGDIGDSGPDNQAGLDPADPAADPGELERWSTFHQAVDQLPAAEREVVSLTFYHGCTQLQIAELLQVSDRQVRRLWSAACARLQELANGQLPNLAVEE